MTTQSLHSMLGNQWLEAHRAQLPAPIEPFDVEAVFETVEAARCSHNVKARGLSVVAYAWRQLLAVGYPAKFREALLAAGVRQALDTMPHLGDGTGDFETDAGPVLSLALERYGLPHRQPSLVLRQSLGRLPLRFVADRGEEFVNASNRDTEGPDMYTLNVPPFNSQHKAAVESSFRQIHESLTAVGYEPPPAAEFAEVRAGDASAALTLNELESSLLEEAAGQSRVKGRSPTTK